MYFFNSYTLAMKLSELVDLKKSIINIDCDVEITGASLNSKDIKSGDVFVAIYGAERDGLSFAIDAVNNGAVAVVCDKKSNLTPDLIDFFNSKKVFVFQVEDSEQYAGKIAKILYPNQPEFVFAITGTNGKTATLQIQEAVLGEISLDKQDLTLYVNKDGSNAQSYKLALSGVAAILGATVAYETDNGETVVSVDQNGLVTAKAVGTATITVKVSAGGVEKTATCNVKVENFPEGIVFEKFEYGVALGSTIQIKPYLLGTTTYAEPVTYSVNKEGIISIDNQGNISTISKGDVEVTATYSMAGQQYQATCTVSVYTPINIADPSTLVGTYEFVEFTSDSSAAFGIKVYVGTKDESKYSGSVQRMIGEMTLGYASGNVNMTTKIQMDSYTLETETSIGDIDPKKEQLALTNYDAIQYAGGGASFGTTGSQQQGIVTQEGDMLLITQSFRKGGSLIGADVTVKTYVRKKSDTVKTLDNTRYFDYKDFAKEQSSNAVVRQLGTGSPAKEPYFSHGVVTYTN